MKKVGLILTPVEFGGAERVCLTLLRNINRDHFNVRPIALIRPWEDKNVFLGKLQNENYECLKIPVSLYERNNKKDYYRVMRCFRILWSIVREEHFDLIHTNGYFADIIGIPVARMMNIPVISTCHGFISNNTKLAVYNALDRSVLRFAKRIIAVSDNIKESLVKAGIREPTIRVIQNSVEMDNSPLMAMSNRLQIRLRLHIQESEFVAGYVGRLSEEKGLRFLIDAISLLKASEIPVKLLLIGDGPQREELEKLVQKKSVANRVIFGGFQGQIENFLPALDLFVLPSLTEGTPMSLLEAMVYRIPIVASNVGGVPNILESGKSGILVEPGSPQALKAAILQLYQDRDMRLRIGKEAQARVQGEYNILDWIHKVEAEYIKALGG